MGQSTTRKLSPEAQETFKLLVPVAALYNLGVLPSEVGSVIRYIIKIAQKKSLTLKQSEKEKNKKLKPAKTTLKAATTTLKPAKTKLKP